MRIQRVEVGERKAHILHLKYNVDRGAGRNPIETAMFLVDSIDLRGYEDCRREWL